MGTHCTIAVEGFGIAKVYKHYDGYPEATLPWLEKINLEFATNRGSDPEYKFAQLLRSSAWDYHDDSRYTGWGVVDHKQEEEYNYIFHKNGTVSYKKGD